MVQSVVKQEELKYLKTKDGAQEAMKQDSTIWDLPDIVRDALVGMPHANSRKTSQKWYDLYDQESMDLTYELYKFDFEVFGYDTGIKERPDLTSPKPDRRDAMQASKLTKFRRNSLIDMSGKRISQRSLFGSVTKHVQEENNLRSSQLKRSLLAHDREDILASCVGVYDHGGVSNTWHGMSNTLSEHSRESESDYNESEEISSSWSEAVVDSMGSKKDK